jgi:hypothetical protein
MSNPRTRRRPILAASVEALERRETPSHASFSMHALNASILAAARSARIHPQVIVVTHPKPNANASLRLHDTNIGRAAGAARAAMTQRAASLAAKTHPAAPVTPAAKAVAVPFAETNTVTISQPDPSPAAATLTKANSALATLYTNYQEYVKAGGQIAFDGSSSGLILKGNSVLVDVRVSGDANALAGSLSAVGFQVQAIEPRFKVIEGFVPIDQLRALDGLSSVVNISGIRPPRHN